MPAIDTGGPSGAGARSFPGLGFDPAEGDAGAVVGLTTRLAIAVQTTAVTLPRLQNAAKVTDKEEWGGGAAEEFSDHGDDLPLALDNGRKAMDTVTRALHEWHGKLVTNQSHADALEREAVRLKKELKAAEAAAAAAADALVSDTTHPEYESRMEKHREAGVKFARIAGELQKVIDAAQRLKRNHENAAKRTADAIRKGADGEPFKPENDTFVVQLSDGLAKAGETVSLVTGTIAAGLVVAAPFTGSSSLVGAMAFERASTGAAAVGAIGQLGQNIFGSRHAKGYLPALLDLSTSTLGPGRLGVTNIRKSAQRFLKNEKITAKELAKSLKDSPLPSLVADLKKIPDPTVREVVEKDLRETGEKAARRFGLDPGDLHPDRVRELGLAAKAATGVADLAGNTQSALEQAGVPLSEEDKNRLRAIQLGLDPTDARTGKILEEFAKDKAKEGKD